jgi:hypothetical protein
VCVTHAFIITHSQSAHKTASVRRNSTDPCSHSFTHTERRFSKMLRTLRERLVPSLMRMRTLLRIAGEMRSPKPCVVRQSVIRMYMRSCVFCVCLCVFIHVTSLGTILTVTLHITHTHSSNTHILTHTRHIIDTRTHTAHAHGATKSALEWLRMWFAGDAGVSEAETDTLKMLVGLISGATSVSGGGSREVGVV